jgi:hypothetical protein
MNFLIPDVLIHFLVCRRDICLIDRSGPAVVS